MIAQVGTRCKYLSTGYQGLTGGNTSRTYFSKHRICANVTSLKLFWVGYYVDQGKGFTDEVNPNNITISAAIEYNGTIYQFKFDGNNSKVLTAGGYLFCDLLPITIPKGALVTIRTHASVSGGGTIYGGLYLDPANGEGGSDYNSDRTLVPQSNANLQASWGFTPLGIIGETSDVDLVSVSLIGDSIFAGENSENKESYIEKQLDFLQIPWVNYSVRGFAALRFKNQSTREGITKGLNNNPTTHSIANMGGANDFLGAGTAQSIYNDTLLLDTFLRSTGIAKIAHTTITPLGTDSSDNWSTVAGQTMRYQNNYRPTYHALLRSNNQISVLEIGAVIAVDINGNLNNDGLYWLPNIASDGVHPTTAGHTFMGGNNALRTQLVTFLVPDDGSGGGGNPPVDPPVATVLVFSGHQFVLNAV